MDEEDAILALIKTMIVLMVIVGIVTFLLGRWLAFATISVLLPLTIVIYEDIRWGWIEA